jgi:hypothetical protein
LAEDAKAKIGVGGGEVEAMDKAANFFVGGGGGASALGGGGNRFEIAAGAEGVEQHRGDALEFAGGGSDAFLRLRRGLGIVGEFVEADGHGLAEIHGAMLFAGGDAEQPVAMAEVFVGEAALFRAEQEGDMACRKALANEARALFEAFDPVLQFARADGGGSDDERAVCNSFGETLVFFSAREQGRSSDGGTRFAERQVVGVHDAEVEKAEVAHSAGGGADVEGIARVDEDDAQTVGFGMGRQERQVYNSLKRGNEDAAWTLRLRSGLEAAPRGEETRVGNRGGGGLRGRRSVT